MHNLISLNSYLAGYLHSTYLWCVLSAVFLDIVIQLYHEVHFPERQKPRNVRLGKLDHLVVLIHNLCINKKIYINAKY